MRATWVILMIALATALGCGGDDLCFQGTGLCYPIESDLWFWVRWVAAGALGLGVLRCLAEMLEDEGFGWGVLALACVAGTWWAVPGFTRYSELSRQSAHAQHESVSAQLESAKASYDASPAGQRDRTLSAKEKLQKTLSADIQPLLVSYGAELQEYKVSLREALLKAAVQSHEALLRGGPEFQESRNQLKRAATLKHSIDWLSHKARAAQTTIGDLDQKAWELQKIMELETVASAEETEAIARIVTQAEAMVELKVSPPAAAEIGQEEAALFRELTSP